MIIRPAIPQDSQRIYQFLCDLEEETLDPIKFEAIFQANLADERIHYLVAELDNQVIGFVSCHVQRLLHHVGLVGEIQELYVLPAYRNLRIGRLLVAQLEQIAQSQGWVNLEVTTNKKRLDTQRFYEQLGFLPTHIKFVKPIEYANI